MSDIPRAQLAVYVAAAVAVVLVGARYLRETAAAPKPVVSGRAAGGHRDASAAGGVRIGAAGGPLVVQVAGAVRHPGVLHMHPGDRVDDAVRRAGGATPRADLAGVNLAAKVEDGRQVIVPARGETGGSVAAAPGAEAAGSAAAAPGAAPAVPLNLNTATAEQLDTLDGVGPATAQKILAYRQQHGGFRSVSELGQVPGIGEKRLAALRDHVRV